MFISDLVKDDLMIKLICHTAVLLAICKKCWNNVLYYLVDKPSAFPSSFKMLMKQIIVKMEAPTIYLRGDSVPTLCQALCEHYT